MQHHSKWLRPVKQRMRGACWEAFLLDLFSNCEWAWQHPKRHASSLVLESVSPRFSWLLSVFVVWQPLPHQS